MNKKTKDTIITILFLTWFFGSIIGLIYFFGIGQYHIGLTLFAQFFIIFGFIFLFSAKSKIGLVPLLVGLSILTCVGIDVFGTEKIKMIFTEDVLAFSFGSLLFIIAGICILVIPRSLKKRNLKRCTHSVIAKCISFSKISSKSRTLYAPIWKYYFNGEFHTSCDEIYSNLELPNVGDTIELFINPKDPKDIYREDNSIFDKITDLLGISGLAGGITLLFFLIVKIINNLQ